MKSPWAFAHAGFELAVYVGVGFIVGYKADAHWDCSPWLMLASTLLGAGLGMYRFLKQVLPEKEKR